MHVKKGDMVQIISGNDKGKIGEIKHAMPKKDRVIIEGVNLRWQHRGRSEQHPKGERVQVEASIHVSNVKLAETSAKGKKG